MTSHSRVANLYLQAERTARDLVLQQRHPVGLYTNGVTVCYRVGVDLEHLEGWKPLAVVRAVKRGRRYQPETVLIDDHKPLTKEFIRESSTNRRRRFGVQRSQC